MRLNSLNFKQISLEINTMRHIIPKKCIKKQAN